MPLEAGRGECLEKSRARYAELHCRTNFSFLEGASHPDELVVRAAELRYEALAITDRNSLAGVVRAHVAAKEVGLKLLIGAEVTPLDAPPVVLLVTDRAAYGRLSRLLTRGRRAAPKGECHLTFADLVEHAEGLIACIGESRGMRSGREQETQGTAAGSLSLVAGYQQATLDSFRAAFSDRCYLLVELHHGPNDSARLQRRCEEARVAGIPVVAANDVHYHTADRCYLQDVLTAIRFGCTVAELGERRFPNAERYLKSPAQMAELFGACPEAVARTREIADRCRFSLDELRYEYPAELCPAGMTPIEHLSRLTWDGARERYPDGLPEKVRQLIEHELKLIEELRYEAYFLTVWDLVRFARSRNILCQGRGSAANSAVCYCLGTTSVDPGRIDVLFERFVSKERDEAPDIDVDFEHERREEVLQYIYEKYGRERAGMTAEVITYRPKSAVRDVGKALGLSLDRVDALAKGFEHFSSEAESIARRCREAGLDPRAPAVRRLIVLMRQILGFPRHLSQHVGGMVITNGPLCELVPIENAAMADRTVIEWSKDDLDELGILKVDCLALGMLTAIHKGFDLIERHYGRVCTLANVPPEDPQVYEMIQRADTMGVFQIESRAQMSMLPRLRPRCFYDLVIEVAIVRPGPIQGDMVHPYLRRRCGEEPVEYPDERIREVLEKTLGVPIFQEQAMRLAIVAAGFTPGEADQLRRAMGAWRRSGVIDQFRRKLIDGMCANGYTQEFAERVFNQIRGFGEYGFPESHSASFALLVYVSAWIKRHYPAAFTAALLNSQPMGFYAPAQLVGDARRHGVEVRPVDVNFSGWDCTLEARPECDGLPVEGDRGARAYALRLGLRMIRGFSQTHALQIVRCREAGGPFRSLDQFARRTGLTHAVLTRLSKADAFGSVAVDRRQALWQSLPEQKPLPLFDALESQAGETEEPAVELPGLSPLAEVVADYRAAGLSLRDHPFRFIRPHLTEMNVARASDLATWPVGRRVKVGGLVLIRQRPGTASGITFVTLEDETGTANLIVRPEVWERYHRAARTAQILLASGPLQRQDGVIHILVDRLEDLSSLLPHVDSRSRDFR